MTWQAFQQTDLWRHNLVDAAPGGSHDSTQLQDHRIIIGAGASLDAASRALEQRRTSYVPLVEERREGRCLPPVLSAEDDSILWDSLSTWLTENPRMINGFKPPSELPQSLGERIYDTVRRVSGRGGSLEGFVGIPPLIRMASQLRC